MECPDTTALDRYGKQVGRHELLSPQDERELGLRVAGGDRLAARRLAACNLRFVMLVANRYRGYGLPLADLVQEGNLGLLRAVEKFDPTRGARFTSYAAWWIRAYITRFVLRFYTAFRLGGTIAQRKLFFRLRSLRSELEMSGAAAAETWRDSAAERLDVSVADVVDMECRLARAVLSLEQPAWPDGNAALAETLAAPLPSPEELASASERSRMLSAAVHRFAEELPERERFIVYRRIWAEEPLSLRAIGERFGITRERVRQIEEVLLARLRKRLSDLYSPWRI